MYHVSTKYLGSNFTFIPRVPKFCDIGEDTVTPRVCVSPIIYETLHGYSIGFKIRMDQQSFRMVDLAFVYKVCDLPDIYKPTVSEVPDIGLYDEYWLLKPTRMKLVGFLDLKDRSKKPEHLRFIKYDCIFGFSTAVYLILLRKLKFYLKKYSPNIGFEVRM